MITYMDWLAPLVVAVVTLGMSWHWRRRAMRAEAVAADLLYALRIERDVASRDPLTALLNRREFYRLGAELIADPRGHHLVAVVVDIDHFKQVNDRYGHATGDEVLTSTARRLAEYAGRNLVARLGGDEFVGLLTSATLDEQWLRQTEERLAATLATPIPVQDGIVTVTVSVGLAPVRGTTDLADVLRRADAAMYRAKARHKLAPLASHRRRSISQARAAHPDGLAPHQREHAPAQVLPLVRDVP
jgi:diguanylate cyclase (GGDEF)-like protein